MTLQEQLAETEARVASLRRRIAAAPCHEAGCDMQHIGGRNAGCERGGSCSCSVPVHVCSRCGDSDYGDNAEASEIRRACRERNPLPEGLIERDGAVLFECRSCGVWTEWPADIEDFDPDDRANVCGGSPRCCP